MAQAVKLHDEQPTAGALITPAEMIGQAITSGSGPEVMEKLLALQERWDARNAKKAFDNAIADLRSHLPEIVKNRTGHNYQYEDLSDIVKAVSPVMAERGLSFRWRTRSDDRAVTVSCIISHRDGHHEETELTAMPDGSGSKNSIQAIGSAVTYLQRYTLKAALGIAAERDDDGQAAAPKQDAQRRKPEPQQGVEDFASRVANAGSHTVLKGIWEDIQASDLPTSEKDDLADKIDARLAQLNKPKSTAKSASDSLDDQFPGDLPKDEHGYTQADYARTL